MAQYKIWQGGTDGDYSDADNWQEISLVNSAYRWLASGSGTSEYYLDLAGGGDPGIDQPTKVLAAGVDMTGGSAGSLAAGEWAWADNDTLGYSTVYVRLSDGADPDSKSDGHVGYRAIPVAGDHVRIPASSTTAINEGLDQSGVSLGSFIVAKGYARTIGTASAFLQITTGRFEYHGSGQTAYIDLSASNIAATITGTGTASTGTRSLYLKGSNLTTVSVSAGSVGLASRDGETATATTVRVTGSSADVICGAGLSLTNAQVFAGTLTIRCAVTTVTSSGGTCVSEETGAITTWNHIGGTAKPESTGTITTFNHEGGSVIATGAGQPRTITTLNLNGGAQRLSYDPAVVTISTLNLLQPVTISPAS